MSGDPQSWEVTDSEIAYSCPGFDIVHEEVILPDGTHTDFDYLSEPPAVVILPLTPDGEIVLIDEWRQAVKRVNRGLPVGSVEPDDQDLAAAARRELREETGYEADTVEHYLSVEPVNGIADSVLHFFLAEGCRASSTPDLDPNETLHPLTMPYEAFRSAVLSGEVRDGRATLGVLYYEATREGA